LSSYFVESIDEVLAADGDVYVINLGVVDSCSREIPYWLYKIFTRKSRSRLTSSLNFFYQNFIARLRPLLVVMRWYTPWVGEDRFTRNIDFIVSTIKANLNADVILVGINSPSMRVEKALPRSTHRVANFNEALKNLAHKHKVCYISTDDFDIAEHYPDGVHFNDLGHALLASRLVEAILVEKEYLS